MATDFTKKEAAEFLKAEELEKHSAAMRYFHDKLSDLHHYVFFVDHIVDFPFDLFIMPGGDLFLLFVLHNFLQMAVLQITKLTTDLGGDARTLNFMDSAVKDEYQADYREVLKKAKFKPRIESLIKMAKHLRDRQIAHAVAPNPGDQAHALTFDEIKEIVRELSNLFEVASFSTEYRYLIMAYDPTVVHPVGTEPRPDIERILDSIARESSVLHLPERNPMAWPYMRQKWSPRKVEQFNRYRRKSRLPEV
jgi:hypothetical protein